MARFSDGWATLLCEDRPVAPLEIAASLRARSKGLLGRDGIEGAILLSPSSGVHTIRMRFPIDVAYLSKDLRLLAVVGMKPNRLGYSAPARGMYWKPSGVPWRSGASTQAHSWGSAPPRTSVRVPCRRSVAVLQACCRVAAEAAWAIGCR